jgi:hypothetical protein
MPITMFTAGGRKAVIGRVSQAPCGLKMDASFLHLRQTCCDATPWTAQTPASRSTVRFSLQLAQRQDVSKIEIAYRDKCGTWRFPISPVSCSIAAIKGSCLSCRHVCDQITMRCGYEESERPTPPCRPALSCPISPPPN